MPIAYGLSASKLKTEILKNSDLSDVVKKINDMLLLKSIFIYKLIFLDKSIGGMLIYHQHNIIHKGKDTEKINYHTKLLVYTANKTT